MRKAFMLGAAGCLIAFSAHSQAPRQELGAHVHGHGTLNVAIEGNRVTLELETPSADIVGFEHAATTPEQKQAIDNARAALADPLALFKLPPSAGCRAKDSTIEIEVGHQHEHEQTASGKAAKAENAGDHADFHVTYALECSAPGEISGIEFEYFKVFAGAQELEVQVITPRSQTSYEVGRESPRIDLSGLM